MWALRARQAGGGHLWEEPLPDSQQPRHPGFPAQPLVGLGWSQAQGPLLLWEEALSPAPWEKKALIQAFGRNPEPPLL